MSGHVHGSPDVRVVAITSEFPWPLDSGGHLRTYHLLRALAQSAQVTLVVPAPPGTSVPAEAFHGVPMTIRSVPIRRRSLWSEASRAANARLCRSPYVFFRRHDHRAVQRDLTKALAQIRPHVVYLDHLDSFAFANRCGRIPLVIDLHNSYSLLARRSAEAQRFLPLRHYLRGEAALLAKTERAVCASARVVLTVSREERSYYQSLGGRDVRLVPNGVDCRAYESLAVGRVSTAGAPMVLYVGGLSWRPNAEAAVRLIAEVMPAVRQHVRDARVCIVGRGAPPDLLHYKERDWVEITGGVPDVRPYLKHASVVAVPLLAGGGTRLKILEAFAAGVPVVSTAVGSEGIDARHGEEILIAEPPEMADAIVGLLRDRQTGRRLAEAARALVWDRYSWDVVASTAIEAVHQAAAASA
jgi:glycosyltransferase involved in cell wall biosynthesis